MDAAVTACHRPRRYSAGAGGLVISVMIGGVTS